MYHATRDVDQGDPRPEYAIYRSRAIAAIQPTVLGRRRRRGRILATKWGMNPNSSSLGVDVTFLLFGAAAVSITTPVVAALLRLRRRADTDAPES